MRMEKKRKLQVEEKTPFAGSKREIQGVGMDSCQTEKSQIVMRGEKRNKDEQKGHSGCLG